MDLEEDNEKLKVENEGFFLTFLAGVFSKNFMRRYPLVLEIHFASTELSLCAAI